MVAAWRPEQPEMYNLGLALPLLMLALVGRCLDIARMVVGKWQRVKDFFLWPAASQG